MVKKLIFQSFHYALVIIDFGPSGFHALNDVLVFFPLLGSLPGQLVEAKHLVQVKEKRLQALIDNLKGMSLC